MRLGRCIPRPEKNATGTACCSRFLPSSIFSALYLSFQLKIFPTLHIVSRTAISVIAKGFALTDKGTDLAGALSEANYCIWCHEQGKDSCSIGTAGKSRALLVLPLHLRKVLSAFCWQVALWMRKFPNSIKLKRLVWHWLPWLSLL